MKRILNLILISTIFLTSACASFRENINPPISNFPEIDNKKSIAVDVDFRKFMNDKPMYFMQEDGRTFLSDNIITRFKQSDMFSEVAELKKSNNPDYTLSVEIINKGDGSMIMAFLTGLSLYIIPSCATDNFEISANLKNNKTGDIHKIKTNDSVTMCQQLFLIFAMPFKFPVSEVEKLHHNIADNLAMKVQDYIYK